MFEYIHGTGIMKRDQKRMIGGVLRDISLSVYRTKSVMTALIAKSIDKTRFSAKGLGQTKPIADNATEDGKAKNRRVEIVKL
ncbi:MAG: OmpA family protein [Bacteroidia bacterium]